jgi:hypothetical protein
MRSGGSRTPENVSFGAPSTASIDRARGNLYFDSELSRGVSSAPFRIPEDT